LADKKSFYPRNAAQRIACQRYLEVQVCKLMGWTPDDIAALPADYYDDVIRILSMQSTRQ